MSTRRRTLHRGTLTAFVDRHHLAWELCMGALALAYLGLSFLVDNGDLVYPWLVGPIAVLFLVEFVARFLDAPSRLTYLRRHWLDLVSSLPFIGGLRSFRLLRLLRLGAGLRVLSAAEHLSETRGRDRDSMWFVVPTLLFTWFAAAAAYWVAEHGANPNLKTFVDALYWAFITASTLGYGSIVPVTAAGRVLAGLVIFVGVGIVGFTSARLTQTWLRDESRHHPRLMLEKLNKLDHEVASIKELLLEQQSRQQHEYDAASGSTDPAPTHPAPRGREPAGARRRSR